MKKIKNQYLNNSEIINWKHPSIQALSKFLAEDLRGSKGNKGNNGDKVEIAKRCFEFVRDEIRHSFDFKVDKITLIASDVLAETTGYCFAKSHLLAALLRANDIPAGLCYQRLSLNDDGAPYTLHGFNAVYLENIGWYRVDPRGNKFGVDAQFTPPVEQLAFNINFDEECTFPEIWPEPIPMIVDTLARHKHSGYDDVWRDLPDIQWVSADFNFR